ncbi:MAG TPA: hypothetical protein VH561_06445 [Micromonosporaceae bacterium]|jgi:hypothetical protein
MSDAVVIASRYNGPPGSGNGGYCSGRFASAAGLGAQTAIEVTLRRPPPLEVEIERRVDDGQVGFWAGDTLIAQVGPADPAPAELVEAVGWDEAVAASAHYPGLVTHPFPTCFVCGTQRAPGDGLRLFPGRLPDGRTATPFLVPPDICPELVWAALDCPGGWAVPLEGRPYVLGRLAVTILGLPQAGQRCVVMGAMTGEDGRKAFTRTSLYAPDGQPLAVARATWLALS